MKDCLHNLSYIRKAQKVTLDCLILLMFISTKDLQNTIGFYNADISSDCTDGASKEMIAKAPKCVYIAKYGAGVDDIDVGYATGVFR